jgi:GNAT superfamily N-acetyltransferase
MSCQPDRSERPRPSTSIVFHEIDSASDPTWPDWMAIYVDSFPEAERMSEDYFLAAFRARAEGVPGNKHALSVLGGPDRDTVGIVYYEVTPALSTAYLWYLAIHRDHRGSGLGSEAYRELCGRLTHDGLDLLVFEVEIPALADGGPDGRRLAEKRIDWYRGLGARLMDGIEYYQSVDTGEPPTKMYLMTHAFAPLAESDVHFRLKEIFQDGIRSELQ